MAIKNWRPTWTEETLGWVNKARKRMPKNIRAGGPVDNVYPAVLSDASIGTEGATSFVGASVSTTGVSGRLYWAIITVGGVATNAQIIAGSGGSIVSGKAGNQAVTGAGTQTLGTITVASGSYELIFLHVLSNGLASNQASAYGNTVLISDTFTASNGTTINGRTPSPINVPGGNWATFATDTTLQIQSNKAVATASGFSGDVKTLAADNFRTSADVTFATADSNFSFIFREQDVNNYMAAVFNPTSVQIATIVSGSTTFVSTTTIPALTNGVTYTYTLEVVGYAMAISITGGIYTTKTEIARYSNASFRTSSSGGVRVHASGVPASIIDNFQVSNWSPPVTEVWTKQAGPILGVGTSGQWDDFWVQMQSVFWNPDVNLYWGYYVGFRNGGTPHTGLATSPDGYVWTKYAGNPILPVGTGWEANWVSAQIVWREGANDYRMFFNGIDVSNRGQIGYATSTDGVTWSKYAGNPVITNTSSGSPWDYPSMGAGHTISLVGGTYYMQLFGSTSTVDFSTYKLGLATATSLTGPWTKHASNPTFIGVPEEAGGPATNFAWDFGVLESSIVYDATATYPWKMYYQGNTNTTANHSYIGIAYSADHLTWIRDRNNPILSPVPANAWESGWTECPIYIRLQSGVEVIYYAASNGNSTTPCQQIGYAIRTR